MTDAVERVISYWAAGFSCAAALERIYMQKRLMILGTQFELCELVRRARSRGIYTIVCDGYPDGPARALADRDYVCDVRDIDGVAEICRREQVDHIITSFSDIMFECMTMIAAKAGLPCYMLPEQLDAYRRKDVTKRICREHGIPVPRHAALMRGYTDSELEQFHFPVIVKPRDSYGSRGLTVAAGPDEVRACFDSIAEYSSTDEVLIEEISTGQELNCTAIVVHGTVYMLAVSDRMTAALDDKHIPINYAQHYPSALISEVCEPVRRILQTFIDVTGQQEGPISTQCFYDRSKPEGQRFEVCEIAGRFFGFEHELVEMSTGLNIEDVLLDLTYDPEHLKERVTGHDPKGYRAAFGLYLTSIRKGRIADQSGLSAAGRHPLVTDSVLFYREGEYCSAFGPKPYFARFYYTGGSYEHLLQTERELISLAGAKDSRGRELLFLPEL